MRVIQTRVYLYTLFPILLLPCALGWYNELRLAHSADILERSCAADFDRLGWLINFYIKKKIVEPILELNQWLEEPEKKLTKNVYSEGSIFQSLLVKLHKRERALDEDLQESSTATMTL